jgi:hypothetical protein
MSSRFPPQRKVRGLFGVAPVRLVLTFTMACLVAGCEEEEPWNPQPVEASQSAIRFDHADLDPDLAEYGLQRYREGGRAHHARFSGADAFADLLVYTAGPCCVVSENAAESWVRRLLNGAEVEWGAAGHTPSRLGYVRYRMFRFADQPFNCVGFSQTFGETIDDRGRKRKLIAGYFCYDETRAPSAATAADLIRQVSVR